MPLLVMAMAGLIAFGLASGWRPRTLAFGGPDLTATAVSIKPLVVKAVRAGDEREIRSLACACDPGLAAVITGPALRDDLLQVRDLEGAVSHQDVSVHRWRVDWTHVVTDARAQVQVSVGDTTNVYQGLVPTQRIEGSYSKRYRIVRQGRVWKVDRSQVVATEQKVVPLQTAPPMTAQEVFVMDDTTGRILYAYHAEIPRLVASTAKMMTAIVARQHLKFNWTVMVPSDALVGGTTAGLVPGERMRVRDLFYGMLLPSGNDAAVTLADASAGSVPQFAAMMNAEAARLHLHHSHFITPHGLDMPGQYSSAHDLALIAHELLRHKFLAGVVRTVHYHAVSADGAYTYNWTNLNHLLGAYPGAIGVKTGTTPGAGANLIAAAVRGNHRLIGVVLGDTPDNRFPDAVKLLNYGWRLLGYGAR